MTARVIDWDGEQVWVLQDQTGATAHIVPAVGANCIAFSTLVGDTRAHLISTPATNAVLRQRPTFCGYPILSPYPGRHTTPFMWDERTFVVDTVERPGVMLHGFAARASWVVEEATASTLVCSLSSESLPDRAHAWPFSFTLRVVHRVERGALSLTVSVVNNAAIAVPHLLGLHPYFPLRFTPAVDRGIALPTAAELVAGDETARTTCHPWVDADDWWEMSAGLGTGRVEDLNSDAGRPMDVRIGRAVTDLEQTLAWSGVAGEIPAGTAPRLPVLLYGRRDALQGASEGRDPWGAGGITSGVDDHGSQIRATLETSAGFPANALFCPPGFPFVSLEPRSAMSNALGLATSHPDLATGIFRLSAGATWQAWARLSATRI